jgi:hypothetical protein
MTGTGMFMINYGMYYTIRMYTDIRRGFGTAKMDTASHGQTRQKPKPPKPPKHLAVVCLRNRNRNCQVSAHAAWKTADARSTWTWQRQWRPPRDFRLRDHQCPGVL